MLFFKLLLIPFGAVALLVAVLLINPWLVIDASSKGFGDSLGAEVSGGSGSCDEVPKAQYLSCDAELEPGSGPAYLYLLRPDDDHCWTAIRVGRRGRASRPDWVPNNVRVAGKPISGCVTLWQEIVPSIL